MFYGTSRCLEVIISPIDEDRRKWEMTITFFSLSTKQKQKIKQGSLTEGKDQYAWPPLYKLL